MLQSSEEAQSGREEVETLNEEFQATNEELETLNEELTASVEELRVANEDLAARTEELRLQTVALEEQKQHGEEEHNRLAIGPREPRRRGRRGRPRGPDRRDEPGLRPALRRPRRGDPAGGPRRAAAAARPSGRSSGRPAASGSGWSSRSATATASRRWFEAVTEPLTSEDRTWGGVVAIRDVSERTMRLSLERLMAAAGHELKTPTAAIHNYLQLVDRHLTAGRRRGGRHLRGPRARRRPGAWRRSSSASSTSAGSRAGQLELLLDVVDVRDGRPIGRRGGPGPAEGAADPR